MAVRIRLTRAGRRHLPFYHINIFDIRQRRNGACIERIGYYDPINKNKAAQVSIDTEKAAYWLSQGALPSETVAGILKKAGVELPARKKKTNARKAKAGKKARKVKERTKKRTSNSKDRKLKKAAKE